MAAGPFPQTSPIALFQTQRVGIQRIGRAPSLKQRDDVVRRHHRHFRSRFQRGAGHVRRQDYVLARQQRGMHFWFVFENIQRRAGNFFIFESFRERSFVHYGPARSIHQKRSAFHLLKIIFRNQVARIRQQRNMQADEIGFAKQPVAIHEFCVQFFFYIRRRANRVIVKHAHLETQRAARHPAADSSKAQNAQRLAPNIAANELIQVPSVPRAGTHP